MTAARSRSTASRSATSTTPRGGSAARSTSLAMRAETGMVFQIFYLFPHLTAAENVMLGLRRVRRKPQGEARDDRRPLARPRRPCRQGQQPALRSSPAASSSASALPAPWRWSPRSCCSTKSPRRSTPSSSTRCSRRAAARRRRHDHDDRDPRDRLRPRRRHRIVFMDGGRVAIEGTPDEVSANNRMTSAELSVPRLASLKCVARRNGGFRE